MQVEDLNATAEIIVKKAVGQSVKVKSVEDWGIGALNACYCVHTSNGKFFLKMENEDILPSTRRGQIEREVTGAQLMQAAGIPCLAVLDYDTSQSVVSRKYLLAAFDEGDLLWEHRENLTESEQARLREDIVGVLDKMQSITSPVFGDIYPNGVIGQHPTWKAAYQSMARILLANSQELGIFNREDLRLVAEALDCGAAAQVSQSRAVFYHGDLGMHNLLADPDEAYTRMGKVIDFGNAIFAPEYANETMTRLHGGFGLEPIDPCDKYGVTQAEYDADQTLFFFETIVFLSMLSKRQNWDASEHVQKFLDACLKLLK